METILKELIDKLPTFQERLFLLEDSDIPEEEKDDIKEIYLEHLEILLKTSLDSVEQTLEKLKLMLLI